MLSDTHPKIEAYQLQLWRQAPAWRKAELLGQIAIQDRRADAIELARLEYHGQIGRVEPISAVQETAVHPFTHFASTPTSRARRNDRLAPLFDQRVDVSLVMFDFCPIAHASGDQSRPKERVFVEPPVGRVGK